MMPTKRIAVDEIRSDGGTQTRAELRTDVIEEYAEAMRNGAEFPPVDVFLDKNGHYWLADGFHRYSAAAIAEIDSISATVHKGELREAIWFALSANTTNGIRLTNADKRRRVEMALADKEWSGMSDRAIAEHVGVGHPFVASVRGELESVTSCETQTRTGRDGKKRKLPKKRRPEPKQPDPPEPDESDDEDDDDESLHPVTIADQSEKARFALDDLEQALMILEIDCDKEIAAIRMKLMKIAA